MVHLIVSISVLSFMIYNLSTVHAYRGSPWTGQRSSHLPGGYPHRAMRGSCCSWALQTPPKFSPDPSVNLPSYFTTPRNKLTTPLPGRNSIPKAECRDGDKVYRVGDKWTPMGGCGRRSCTTAGETTILGCPTPEPRGNCSVSAPDPRQPWPFCCPKLDCP